MNGIEATKEIISLLKEKNMKPMPIVGCSAFESKIDI